MSEAGEQARECPWCGGTDHFNEECTVPVTGDQVKRVTVEEARQNIIDNYIEDGWELPILNAHLDDFEAAVREDERERARELVRALLEADNLTGILDPDQDETPESRAALEHLNHVFSRALKELQP